MAGVDIRPLFPGSSEGLDEIARDLLEGRDLPQSTTTPARDQAADLLERLARDTWRRQLAKFIK